MTIPAVQYLGVLLAFGALLTAFSAAADVALERRETSRMLRGLKPSGIAPRDLRRRELAAPFRRRVLVPAARRLGRLGRRLTPLSVVERLNRQLVHAGSPPSWDAERLLGLKMLGAGLGVIAAVVLVAAAGLPAPRAFVLGAGLLVVGYYMPEWSLRAKAGARQKVIQRALPDALDLLSITVEAGLGFDAAVARVARQAGGPLGEEFSRVLREMRIGKPRADALRALADRTTVEELKSFVLAMTQADVFGISVARVLHVQAAEMRLKRSQRAEEQAQKVPVKIVFPLLLCIFPALFTVIMGPAVIQIAQSILGR